MLKAQSSMVKASCPVRIDIAGGWTDTPPYCMMEGGNVVNLAVNLDGRPPIEATVSSASAIPESGERESERALCQRPILLESLDQHVSELVETPEQLADYKCVGSPFSISKGALSLMMQRQRESKLTSPMGEEQGVRLLQTYSSIPAGSGLGTSSILAATVLAVLSKFYGLGWDNDEIGRQTLVLEQMLTTGGGWQDQFGGLMGGVKLLQTSAGTDQTPVVTPLPPDVFIHPDYAPCHLLYYTGLTRTAKIILAEIVERMHQREPRQMALLAEMKQHALDMADAIRQKDFEKMGRLVRLTWTQNQLIDSGTNPPAVRQMTELIDDLCLGYKLPGAGGGGFLYMVAKDAEAASRIRQRLTAQQPNPRAGFVEMSLATNGLRLNP